ncbi:hypothetical protein UF75_2892 [Desulfosporosinus sp. I2]|nr:hypothetical protein UF75_2892 [Desulfosporosinus sp. I2]
MQSYSISLKGKNAKFFLHPLTLSLGQLMMTKGIRLAHSEVLQGFSMNLEELFK